MPLKDARHCAAVIFLLACALISTSAASADLVRLADILAPVLRARQFAVLCRAADPQFGEERGSLGTVQPIRATCARRFLTDCRRTRPELS
jgi:hypothetical protein